MDTLATILALVAFFWVCWVVFKSAEDYKHHNTTNCYKHNWEYKSEYFLFMGKQAYTRECRSCGKHEIRNPDTGEWS